jgi:hypothetical protein
MAEGPAEPPELVPAYGETPVEDQAEEPPLPALVVSGEMAPHEPIVEAPVSFFVPEPEPEHSALGAHAPADPPVEELDYIDIELDPVASEVEPPAPQKAAAPASAPGVPFKPEVEPAAE